MKLSIRHRRLASGIVAAAAAATMPLAPAHAEPPGSDVPSTIAVEEGHKVFLVGHAVGVQIYTCNPSTNGFAWSFVAPRADLFGDNGKLVATHFGGPRWQARDGSTVRAARRGDPVTVDPTAIPWLLLSTVATSTGHDGDQLTHTAFIQRTATTGGLPPAPEECNANTMDTTEEVPYTADYHFWKSTGH
jgi:Protein of unknown function (DUF3455)